MAKVTLDVENVNLETLMLILENLKNGLISNIEVEKTSSKYRTSYKPKQNKIVYENEQLTNKVDGKYLNASSFKNRIKKGL